jgi:aminomuconate-semialdehyde/2-hydroxymuconate-6-semialdehyde dehydrogenase
MEKILNYINGQLVPAISGRYLEKVNPATGQVYCLFPDSDENDVEEAVHAARKAFSTWSTLPVNKRSAILMEISRLITDQLERLARAETIDSGKPLWLSRTVDIPRAAANFEFYATAAIHLSSEAHITDTRAVNYTLRQPIGVAGCISPWNLPLYLFSWKIAPALAAGCTVVAKPSELTPMTAFMLSELCTKAGLPPGVLNIVHGHGKKAGAAIVQHKDIPAISFTGGTQTGAWIASAAAPLFKKLSLELGGKNPNIIFADCLFEETIQTSLQAAFSNQGEICLCGSRIFIEKSLYEPFRQAFVEQARTFRPGNPLDEATRLGAIISENHLQKILSYIDLAQKEGGTILTGGQRVMLPGENKNGYFLEPTVIEGLPYDCRTNQEEIFGPVVTLMPFESEDEVLHYANSVPYGLSATIFTQNLSRAHRMAAALQCGVVWINCWLFRDLRTPFGGMKQSGLGREGGFEALKFFTEEKNVCVKL